MSDSSPESLRSRSLSSVDSGGGGVRNIGQPAQLVVRAACPTHDVASCASCVRSRLDVRCGNVTWCVSLRCEPNRLQRQFTPGLGAVGPLPQTRAPASSGSYKSPVPVYLYAAQTHPAVLSRSRNAQTCIYALHVLHRLFRLGSGGRAAVRPARIVRTACGARGAVPEQMRNFRDPPAPPLPIALQCMPNPWHETRPRPRPTTHTRLFPHPFASPLHSSPRHRTHPQLRAPPSRKHIHHAAWCEYRDPRPATRNPRSDKR